MELTEGQKQVLRDFQRWCRSAVAEAEKRHQEGVPMEILEREIWEAQDV